MSARYNRKDLLRKLHAAIDAMRHAFNATSGVASKDRLVRRSGLAKSSQRHSTAAPAERCRSAGPRSNPLFGRNGRPEKIGLASHITGPGGRE
jgi:hypothetical protein